MLKLDMPSAIALDSRQSLRFLHCSFASQVSCMPCVSGYLGPWAGMYVRWVRTPRGLFEPASNLSSFLVLLFLTSQSTNLRSSVSLSPQLIFNFIILVFYDQRARLICRGRGVMILNEFRHLRTN